MKLNNCRVYVLSKPFNISKLIFEVAGFGKNLIIFAVASWVMIPCLFCAKEIKVIPSNKIDMVISFFSFVKIVNSFKQGYSNIKRVHFNMSVPGIPPAIGFI